MKEAGPDALDVAGSGCIRDVDLHSVVGEFDEDAGIRVRKWMELFEAFERGSVFLRESVEGQD